MASVPHINRADLELVRAIGEGGFGSVFHMTWKRSGTRDLQHVAAKRLYKVESPELDILSELKHPNVVRLIGVVPDELDFMLVLELCNHGSLRSYLDRHDKHPLPTELFEKWSREAAKAIRYLHQMGIIHKDVKSQNYFISGENVLKLGDFGLAEKMVMKKAPPVAETGTSVEGASQIPITTINTSQMVVKASIPETGISVAAALQTSTTTTPRGSWTHMAPELQHTTCKLSPKFDIFSFGVVLWEMLTGQVPYESMSYQAIISHVCRKNRRLEIPRECPRHLADLMVRCWQGNQEMRPDIDQVMRVLGKKTTMKTMQEKEVDVHRLETMMGSIGMNDHAYSSFLSKFMFY